MCLFNVREVSERFEFFLKLFVPSTVPIVEYSVPDRTRWALSNAMFKNYDNMKANEASIKIWFITMGQNVHFSYFLKIFVTSSCHFSKLISFDAARWVLSSGVLKLAILKTHQPKILRVPLKFRNFVILHLPIRPSTRANIKTYFIRLRFTSSIDWCVFWGTQ